MSSIGTGYDLSASTYSPDGRVFQVQYATKAVENSGTSIGLKCTDGVVLGCEKIVLSKMLEPSSNRRVNIIDKHVGLAASGLMADTSRLLDKARKEAKQWRNFYGYDVPVRVLMDRLAGFVQMHTIYAVVRPFGCSGIMGGIDETGPQLYKVEPSGVSWGYLGCAAGKGKQAAKTEIEKLDLANLTCAQAVVEIAKIIYKVHDELKDKEFVLEMGWACKESGNKFASVPQDTLDEAIKIAVADLESDSDDDMDE
mmetsp:Transcript_6324/g.6873  ORF Transcript_6324/g.6873 Transcript_6324/m.6873 type:complete len:254 (+) Transcript_6324:49-810(+)